MIRVRPAYGKRYFNESEVKKDWLDNKDFLMVGEYASYMNKRDYKKYVGAWDTVIFQDGFLSVKLEDGVF